MSRAEPRSADGCPHTHKKQYKSQAKAKKAKRNFKGHDRSVHVYICPGGEHYHLGSDRIRNAQEIYIDLFWRGGPLEPREDMT